MPAAKPKGIIEALVKVQDEVPKLQKDAINPHFGNRYVALPTVLEAVLPVLKSNDLLLIQTMDNVRGEPSLRTRLIHVPTGESVEGNCPLKLDRATAQGVGSAVTYYRRYELMSLLGIVADEDDDGAQAGNAVAPAANDAANAPVAVVPSGTDSFGGSGIPGGL